MQNMGCSVIPLRDLGGFQYVPCSRYRGIIELWDPRTTHSREELVLGPITGCSPQMPYHSLPRRHMQLPLK